MSKDGKLQSTPSSSYQGDANSSDLATTPNFPKMKANITKKYNEIAELIALRGPPEKVQEEYDKFLSLVKNYWDEEKKNLTGTPSKTDDVGPKEKRCKLMVDMYLGENNTSGTDATPSVMQLGVGKAAGEQKCTTSGEKCRNETPRKPKAKIEFAKLRLEQLDRRQTVDKEMYKLNQKLERMELEKEKEFAELEAKLGQNE